MFAQRYYGNRAFAPRYFPKIGASVVIVFSAAHRATVTAADRLALVWAADRTTIVPEDDQ